VEISLERRIELHHRRRLLRRLRLVGLTAGLPALCAFLMVAVASALR
jgi:hypothetical protein